MATTVGALFFGRTQAKACHAGCDASCVWPKGRCCVSYGSTCLPYCPQHPGYCVKDPEFCVYHVQNVCDTVPKKVCAVKPVCHPVKHEVCDWVKEEKCEYVHDKECKDVVNCHKVPKCYTKQQCTGGSVAKTAASAVAKGGHSTSIARGSAFAGNQAAKASGHALARGSFSRANVDTTARSGGCHPVKVCDEKEECKKDHVCKPIRRRVCKKVPVWKCKDTYKDVCKNEESCDVVHEKVCTPKKVKVCKEPVKCYDKLCAWGEKCNPDCCPVKKIPFCLVLKAPAIVKVAHG